MCGWKDRLIMSNAIVANWLLAAEATDNGILMRLLIALQHLKG